jgi:hypothetical protein
MIMYTFQTFKLLPVAAAVAILAACGGSDDPVATAAQMDSAAHTAPFASPAMFLGPGQASKAFPLTGCGQGVQSATFTIFSNGDMALTGALSGTTTISQIKRINYADATGASVSAGNSGGVFADVSLSQVSDYLSAYSSGFFSSNSSAGTINCNFTGSALSLAVLPSAARLSSEMLSGITSIDTSRLSGTGTFAAPLAYWDNYGTSSSYAGVRYFSLNMTTGAFTTSPSPSIPRVSETTYPLTVPANTSTNAYFSERISSGVKSFFFNSNALPCVSFQRVGNALRPEDYNYCD